MQGSFYLIYKSITLKYLLREQSYCTLLQKIHSTDKGLHTFKENIEYWQRTAHVNRKCKYWQRTAHINGEYTVLTKTAHINRKYTVLTKDCTLEYRYTVLTKDSEVWIKECCLIVSCLCCSSNGSLTSFIIVFNKVKSTALLVYRCHIKSKMLSENVL